jgi:hypothetical protein
MEILPAVLTDKMFQYGRETFDAASTNSPGGV